MTRIISPPKNELDKLRQPLEEGERRVFEFFDRFLPPQWEIYTQPHLNGLRPDFVLLHPNIGIAVFEVKNWNLDAMDYWIKHDQKEKPPILMGRKDGEDFSLQNENPVEKVLRYKQEIYNLYCPRLGQRSGFATISAGVIFPSADDVKVTKLCRPILEFRKRPPLYHPVAGRQALESGDLSRVFPESTRQQSKYMTPELANDLRLWLVEPDAPKTQRTPLELDKEQEHLATSRTKSGYRRITGPAGSGKSIVLAARAAELIKHRKDVLVISFNITLINYLADAASRNNAKARISATWLNFHAWCGRVCDEAGFSEDYKKNFQASREFPDEQICSLAAKAISETSNIHLYDAILVDEGQDFKPEWWNLLRKVCKPNGEMVLAADATQDIYGRSHAWTDGAMQGAGFAGNWARLKTSYRLPSGFIDYVYQFGKQFLPNNTRDLPPPQQQELKIDPIDLRWIQISPQCDAASIIANEINNIMLQASQKQVASSDITVLIDNKELGKKLVGLLERKNVRCLHTFSAQNDVENDSAYSEERKQKLSFFMGDARLKITTLHSFKGWETRALIVCVQKAQDECAMALLYAGLTRVKRNSAGSLLSVICGEPKLAEYGKSWPNFVKIG